MSIFLIEMIETFLKISTPKFYVCTAVHWDLGKSEYWQLGLLIANWSSGAHNNGKGSGGKVDKGE